MESTGQLTFWQFTLENAKEAFKLYFRPIRQAIAWLVDERLSADVQQLKRELHEERLRVDELHEQQRQHRASNEALMRTVKQNEESFEVRLRDIEHRLNPAFDSLEDLELRIKRLGSWLGGPGGSEAEPDVTKTVRDLATQLVNAQFLPESEIQQDLAYIRHKLRQLEVYCGFEEKLSKAETKRTKGASGN